MSWAWEREAEQKSALLVAAIAVSDSLVVTISLQHILRSDPETYWRDFFDSETSRDFFMRGLGFKQFDVVSYSEDEHAIQRVVRYHAHVVLPRAIAAIFGSGFRYLENGVFDKATGLWKFIWIPAAFPERILLDGWTRAEPRAEEPDTCDRISEMRVEARFPGIGGLLERQTARFLRDQWDRSARVNNEWLERRRVEGRY